MRRRGIEGTERLVSQQRGLAGVAARAEDVFDVPDDVVSIAGVAVVGSIAVPGQRGESAFVARNDTGLSQEDVVFEYGQVGAIRRIMGIAAAANEQGVAVAGDGVVAQRHGLAWAIELHHHGGAVRAAHRARHPGPVITRDRKALPVVAVTVDDAVPERRRAGSLDAVAA